LQGNSDIENKLSEEERRGNKKERGNEKRKVETETLNRVYT